ncbi:MAG: insulinase family protein, partial [Bacteroidales bacterium]
MYPIFKKESSKQVKPVNPVFVDYTKDIVRGKVGKEVELLYTKNVENPTFELVYLFEMGRNNDKIVDLAASYLNYLGTSKYSAEQIQQEFYKLACTFQTEITNDRIYIQIDGLSKNMGKAIALVESLMSDCQADAAALKNLKMDILKMRKDEKANQSSNVSALLDYAIYGKNSPTKNILSEKELNAVSSKELIEKLRNMFDYEHQILYYGPDDLEDVLKIFNKLHKTPKDLKPVPEAIKFTPLPTTENRIVFAPYKAKQSYCYTITRDDIYNKDLMPVIEMYNTYFGGGMNAIVFQELREKRSLAYSCGAFFKRPSRADGYFINLGMIATQNDKVADALTAFDDLYNHMPVSDIAYKLSLESTLSDIRTERKSKLPLLFGYLRDKKFGYSEDSRKVLYEIIPTLSLKDVENFNEKHIKNKPKTYMILGDEKDFDFNALEKKFGKVE